MGYGGMRTTWMIAALAASALAGCSEVADHQATSNAQTECQAKGMQFYQTDSHRTELLLFGEAEVQGVCVGPGDPHYVQGK